LNDVLGFSVIAHETKHDREYSVDAAPGERLERSHIAALGEGEQLRLWPVSAGMTSASDERRHLSGRRERSEGEPVASARTRSKTLAGARISLRPSIPGISLSSALMARIPRLHSGHSAACFSSRRRARARRSPST
jgi:hypothetical protein